MKHRIHERIIYEKYVSLNRGLEHINATWGDGCPVKTNRTLVHELKDVKMVITEHEHSPTPIRFLKKYGEAWLNHPDCPLPKLQNYAEHRNHTTT